MSRLSQGSDFWSRRRAAVQAEAEAETAALRAAEAEAAEAACESAAAEKTDEEILAELGLPDPDAMGQGDDFAAFLNAVVPERIRRRALRRLWRSNPVLANLDGLVDHGEDYSDSAMVLPGMQSAYQVGRGMLRHVMAQTQPQGTEEGRAEAVVAIAADEDLEDAMDAAPEAVAFSEEPDEAAAPAARRHMRFSFPGRGEGEERA